VRRLAAALSEAIRAEGIRTEFFSDTDEPETLAGRLLFSALSAAALAQPTDEPSDHEHGQQESDDHACADEHKTGLALLPQSGCPDRRPDWATFSPVF
jgi:hypothetical protein